MSDNDSGIRLTRRRLLGGVAATGAATAGLGAGTYALYTDSEQSTNNTVKSGTLNLALTGDEKDPVGGFSSLALADTTPYNLKPGDQVKFKLTINNRGSLRGDYLNLDFGYTTAEGTAGGSDEPDTDDQAPDDVTPDMGKLMDVAKLSYSVVDSTTGTVFRSQSSSGPGGTLDSLYRTDSTEYEYAYDDNNIVDLANLADASEDSSTPDIFTGLTPPPAGGSAILEGTFVYVDTSNRVAPTEVYTTEYSPTYTGPQENNWFHGDTVTLQVDAEMGQS